MKKIIFFIFAILFCINSYALPNGYTQLEYLETSGTQWICTAIRVNNNDDVQIEMDAAIVSGTWMGANGFLQLSFYDNVYDLGGGGSGVTIGQRDKININYDGSTTKNESLYINDTLIEQSGWGGWGSLAENRYTIFSIFGITHGSCNLIGIYPPTIGKLYSAKVVSNGVLAGNYIPARRDSDGVLGLYDTVTGTLFTNAGTGTFIAGPVAGLPKGYTRLEYLQTNDGAYIDTGIKLNASSKFDFKFVPGTWYNYAVFGADNGAYYDNGEIALFYYWSSGYGDVIEAVLPYSNTSSSVLDPRPSMQQNMVYTVSYDKDYLVVNGASQSSGWYADYVGNRNAYLFATNRGDTTWAGGDTKIYYFKMYNGNNLVRDFIPAKRNSDGVLGMYDTVSNTFFTNAGSGDFIAGYGIASTSYVQGMYEAINNSKMEKLNPNSIEFTPDSSPYGFFTAVEGAGDKFRFKREEITLPFGSYDNPTGRMSIWLE